MADELTRNRLAADIEQSLRRSGVVKFLPLSVRFRMAEAVLADPYLNPDPKEAA
jgi:hypothetical protein